MWCHYLFGPKIWIKTTKKDCQPCFSFLLHYKDNIYSEEVHLTRNSMLFLYIPPTLYQNILIKLNCWPLGMNFFQRERGLELVSLTHFLHDFWRKTFLVIYFNNRQKSIVWLLLLLEILGNVYQNDLFPSR